MSEALEKQVLTSKRLFKQTNSWKEVTKLRLKDNSVYEIKNFRVI